MIYAYSEDTLIEQTAIAIFKYLKWETANVYQNEKWVRDLLLPRLMNQTIEI